MVYIPADSTCLNQLLQGAQCDSSIYVDARYNTSYAVSKEELEILAGWVRDLRERVERVCGERIQGLGNTDGA